MNHFHRGSGLPGTPTTSTTPPTVAAERLPDALHDWVRHMTREAIGLIEAMAEEDAAFAAAVDQLRNGFAGLG